MKILEGIFKVLLLLVLGIILFMICALTGYMVTSAVHDATKTPALIEYIICLVGAIFSIFLCTIIHESGHLVFGLLSGYKFSSFRIFSFMWVRLGDKIKLRRFKLQGTAGQCLMSYPDFQDGKIPVVLYNLGGVIFNLVFGVICLLIYLATPYDYPYSTLIGINGAVSIMLAVTNGIPFKFSGMPNDGMNTLVLAGNESARIAFAKQLKINATLSEGKFVSQMPAEWFELPKGADMSNMFCATIPVFAIGRVMESMDFERAEKEIAALLKSDYNIAQIHRYMLNCDLVYCRLVLHGKSAEISSLLTVEQQRFMQGMKKLPSVVRTEHAIAFIRDENAEKAEKIKQNFEKITKTYPYQQDVESERRFISYTENKSFS